MDRAGENPDDFDSQESIDQGAAELEAVRRAEEKAGLVPQAPGAGPRDGLAMGLSSWDPLARDLAAALGSSVDGAPLADPAPHGAGKSSLPELAGISAEELRAKYDIPVELNDAVIAYLRFFQTDAREHFGRWLSRSTRWLPTMRGILQQQGVPLDLVYLSMIESGFNAYAYSFAKASGLWQFVVGTSRRYGLTSDFWVDERRDPIKATQAAGFYLKDLHERFHGDWYLAWAGYNAGEGKVDKAIRKESTLDFWRMMDKGRTLRAETKHYVPKLIAAALIAKHPERFGFHLQYEPAFEFDEVRVPSTDLRALARAAGTTVEELRALNPELRRFCTPPGEWTVRLPKGTHDSFVAAFEKLPASERLSFAQHNVERGESLGKIAKAYGVSEQVILRTNGLTSHKQVKVGRSLVVPLQGTRGLAKGEQLEDQHGARFRTAHNAGRSHATAAPSAAYSAVAAAQKRAIAAGAPDPADVALAQQERDAKATLSRKRGPSKAKAIAQAKAQLARGPAGAGTYVVQAGDSLWTIATRFSTTVERLIKLNNLSKRGAGALQPGQTISVAERS